MVHKTLGKGIIHPLNFIVKWSLVKKLAELTEQDLKGLLYSDTINKFVKPLRDRGIKDTTIKGHLIAMRSYIKMIRREKIFSGIDFNLLMTDALVLDHVSVRDTQHHEAMSLEELHDMEEWLRSKPYQSSKKDLGKKYAMLIDFMFRTAIRLTATFNVKWSNFTLLISPYGGNWAKLEIIDKGKKRNTKYLTQEYYYKLKELFYQGNVEEEIFHE